MLLDECERGQAEVQRQALRDSGRKLKKETWDEESCTIRMRKKHDRRFRDGISIKGTDHSATAHNILWEKLTKDSRIR